MICPYCGAENPKESNFCDSCGYDMHTYAEEPAVEETISSTKTDQKKQSRKPFPNGLPHWQTHRQYYIAALGLLALIIGIFCWTMAFQVDNGYDIYAHNIMVELDNGKVVILTDADKAIPTDMEAIAILYHQTSIDGNTVAFMTNKGQLAVIQKNKLTIIADSVSYFVLSVDGTGIGYVTTGQDGSSTSLMLYNVKTRKTKTVTDDLQVYQYDLSPDGDSVAYYTKEGDRNILMYYQSGKSTRITDSKVNLIGLSNDGKYIYALGKDEAGVKQLYCYNKNGRQSILGSCNSAKISFNADHTQILYYDSDMEFCTYISANGQPANQIVAAIAYPLLPGNCKIFTSAMAATYPTNDLYGKVYTSYGDGGHDVWNIQKKAAKTTLLVSRISNATLSDDGEHIYYLEANALKVLQVQDGNQAAEKAKKLATDVGIYLITSDDSHIYYTSNGKIYSVNAKTGTNKRTVSDVLPNSNLYINGENIVYFLVDRDVYASENGIQAKLVLSDALSLHSSENGIVYVFMKDDSIYATSGTKKPQLVWSAD